MAIRNSLLRRGWLVSCAVALSSALFISTDSLSAMGPAQGRAGVTDAEVTLGSCLPLSGTLKQRAEEVASGAKLYFSYINDQGGVFGRKIKLELHDDNYDPEKAIDCFNTYLKDKVFSGFLFLGSAPIAKYVRMADISKLPMLGYCTGTPIVYDFHPTQFTIRPSYADEVMAVVDQLVGVRGLKRIAVIYQNDVFGAAIRESVLKALRYRKLAPVAEASYSRDASEIVDAFNRLKPAEPEAVILGATSSKLVTLIKKKNEDKWKTVFVAFSVGADYLAEEGKSTDGTVVMQTWPTDEHLATLSLYNKLRKKYQPSAKRSFSALEGMVNAMVLVEGLKRAGKDLTREKFIAALETMHNYDIGLGANYKINFNSGNHSGLTSKAVYCTVMKDGQLVPMSPADWKQLRP